ncbi:hypothetical protein GCM10010270_71130 [Streptomyces violaceus]|nr:hypothetical protein GCM10010270_71130 [Streptomyces janthinus]
MTDMNSDHAPNATQISPLPGRPSTPFTRYLRRLTESHIRLCDQVNALSALIQEARSLARANASLRFAAVTTLASGVAPAMAVEAVDAESGGATAVAVAAAPAIPTPGRQRQGSVP